VRIEQFDALTDDARLRACHAMTVAAQPQDDPHVPATGYQRFRSWWALGDAGSLVETWLASDGGEPVGAYMVELPQLENRGNAFADMIVAPAHRRRGHGRLLLAHLAARAAQADRALVMADTRIGAAGSAFAAATGGRAGLRDARRIQDIDADLARRLPALRAAAAGPAAGYRLRSWSGPAPEDLVSGLSLVYTAFGDAPHDESFEPATFDAGRVREEEQRLVARGARWHSVAALSAATGEVAAVTQVVVNPDQPAWGWQAITAVTARHRGHRLGLLVKVAMLEGLAAREPGLQRIVTHNAERNDHMIAVNEQLGYRVTDYFQAWEHDVAAVLAVAG
jgi:GNAT superfamily N-acetyltransferase/RimJ/RimL family protein N-acetyltransferase